ERELVSGSAVGEGDVANAVRACLHIRGEDSGAEQERGGRVIPVSSIFLDNGRPIAGLVGEGVGAAGSLNGPLAVENLSGLRRARRRGAQRRELGGGEQRDGRAERSVVVGLRGRHDGGACCGVDRLPIRNVLVKNNERRLPEGRSLRYVGRRRRGHI